MATAVTLHGGQGSDTINFAFTVTGTNTTRYTTDFATAVNTILSNGGSLTPVTGTAAMFADSPAATTVYDLTLPPSDTIPVPSFAISGSGYVIDTISGAASVSLTGSDTVLVAAINAASTITGAGGHNQIIFVTGNNEFVGTADTGGDTVVAGSGFDSILTSKSGQTTVNSGTGSASITLQDTTAASTGAFNDFVWINDGTNKVYADGTRDAVFATVAGQSIYGAATTTVGTLGVVLSGNSTGDIVSAGATDTVAVYDDASNNTIMGGSQLLYFIGESKITANVVSGSGTVLGFGASGDNITLTTGMTSTGSPASGIMSFAVGSGNETLNGAGATGNLFLFGSGDSTSASTDSLVGGYGNDLLVAGYGAETLTGGAGANTFLIDSAASAMASVKITDFLSGGNNTLDLSGFSNPDSIYTAGSEVGGAYVVTLDKTTITFVGVTSGSQLEGHVVTF